VGGTSGAGVSVGGTSGVGAGHPIRVPSIRAAATTTTKLLNLLLAFI